ncbi:hypothetical protein HT031_004997 [Scenedesmus sp. PABB004]|nr:hypothetical protein HT031_004997 [Scenedesmus sp. PABB004]
MAPAASASAPAAAPGRQGRVWGMLLAARLSIISLVNARFLKFRWALLLAVLVGVLTLGGVAVIAWLLVTHCDNVCASVPLALVPRAPAGLASRSCVGFKTRALSISPAPRDASRALYTDTLGDTTDSRPDPVWDAFSCSSPSATLGKCSFQHSAACGLQEWLATFQARGRRASCRSAAGLVATRPRGGSLRGPRLAAAQPAELTPRARAARAQGLAALAAVAGGSANVATADWPNAAGFYTFAGDLEAQTAAVMAAAHGSRRLTRAGTQRLLAAGGNVTLGGEAATLFVAPPWAACCDVTTAGTKLGSFAGRNSRFVVQLAGRRGLSLETEMCTTTASSSNTTGRCSWTELSAGVPVGMSASVCQFLGVRAAPGGNATAPPAPYQICLNGSMPDILVPLAPFFDLTGACPTLASPNATAVARARPLAEQQLAATLTLLPLAHEFGMAVSAFLSQAYVDVEAAAQRVTQGRDAMKGDLEAASWWLENQLFCCDRTCPSWLSSVGSALGYTTYVEGGVALVVLLVYLTLLSPERRRLRNGLRGVAGIAFQSSAPPSEAGGRPAGTTAVVPLGAAELSCDGAGAGSRAGSEAGAKPSSARVSGRGLARLPGSAVVRAWAE